MDRLHYLLTFENCLPHEARSAAEDLEMTLFQAFPDITIDWERSHPRTQNSGYLLNILVPILGTPTVVVFASILKDWLKRRKDVIVTLRNGKREIIFQNLTFEEAEQVLPRLEQLVFSESSRNEEEGGKHAQSTE